MTAEPTDVESNGDSDKRPLQTLRAWAKEPCGGIGLMMAYINRRGLGDAIWEVIPLEDAPPSAGGPDGRPRNSILVDLAVFGGKMDRVIPHFVPVPLSDVSLVSLVPDSNVGATRVLLRHYRVHARYMQQYARRKLDGSLCDLGIQWYDNRFNDMVVDERRATMQD